MRLAVDAMGGDFGPPVIVPAALRVLRKYKDLELLLYGDLIELDVELQQFGLSADDSNRVRLHNAESLDPSDCDGKAVLLRGRQSSLFKAVSAIAGGQADTCFSAGSSAALMVAGLRLLKPLPTIRRPAICKAFPQDNGHTYLLDLGANAECTAENLYQFALLATVLAKTYDHKKRPSVALLSNGIEHHKGTRVIREAARLMRESPQLDYVGYIEADRLFDSEADIIVCDGFSGNLALKASEGASRLLLAEFEQTMRANEDISQSLELSRLNSLFAPARHNGAFFLGLNGVIIKSHGGADLDATEQSLQLAYNLAKSGCVDQHNKIFHGL